MSAEAVVLSTKIAPWLMPAKAPLSPSTTARRCSSLPTQQNTISRPAAASLGVRAADPLCFWVQASALAKVRLYTTTSWPLAARCPAIGKPITPSPKNATLAMVFSRRFARRIIEPNRAHASAGDREFPHAWPTTRYTTPPASQARRTAGVGARDRAAGRPLQRAVSGGWPLLPLLRHRLGLWLPASRPQA